MGNWFTLGMAKRGETRPWRMHYKWSNGVTGVVTYRTLAEATFAAGQQAERTGPNGETCESWVTVNALNVGAP